MKLKLSVLTLVAAFALAACFTVTAVAQDAAAQARPMYTVRTPNVTNAALPPTTNLPTWNGSFVYSGVTYRYNMVGTAPSTNSTTTIKNFLVPIALKFSTGQTYSPATIQSNGASAVTNTLNSPIYQSNVDFVSPDGTDLGTTQYIDAFQRGNFSKNGTTYHVLLGKPLVAPVQTLTVPSADGRVQSEFGFAAGTADINWFDAQLQTLMKRFPSTVTSNTFPVFIIYNSYLTEFGGAICCIGGYHGSFTATTGQTAYAVFSYVGIPGKFAQDVSALSHEVGEWMDDPLVININGNTVACGSLEVGDPEESFPNFGAFPYTVGGFTYNLQDLVYLEYFGAPKTTSVDGGTLSLHDNPFGLGICSQGG